MSIPANYRVGLTADGAEPDGHTIFGDIGLHRLTDQGIAWEVMPPMHDPDPSIINAYDAVLSFGHMPFGGELARDAPRLKHVCRFGAGFDGIDAPALAAEGVILTTTPLAVRTPVAMSALTLLFAVAHKLLENHDAARRNAWNERGQHRGIGVAGRTVGIVGFGGIGQEVARLLQPMGVTIVATDQYEPAAAAALNVEMVPLPELAAVADFVIITLSLNKSSSHLIGESFLSAMKPSAYLINVSRGGVVDQAALAAALQGGQIAGAGLDVFDPEPPQDDEPLLRLSNVTLSPHSLCWTEDFSAAVSASVMESLLGVARGERVPLAIDKSVFDRPWRAQH